MAGINRTLYIKPEDQEVWQKAKKYLGLYEGKGLSEVLTECLKQIVSKYESIPREERLTLLEKLLDEKQCGDGRPSPADSMVVP